MNKRFLSILICLCLCVSLLPTATFADETSYDIHVNVVGYDGGGGVFLVDENGELLSGTLYKNGDIIENVTGTVYCACLGEYPYTREITDYQGDVEVTFIMDPTAIVHGPGANGYAELTVTYSEASGDASGGASDEPFAVNLTVNYPDDYTGDCIGGLGIYDEDGNLVQIYNESSVIDVNAGEILITKVIEIDGLNMSSSWANCGAYFIGDVEYTAFHESGSVEITYLDESNGDAGGEMDGSGPQPAVSDFNVVLNIKLPDDYTGDGAVVTRKTRESGDGAVVDFGDGMTYGNGDIVAIKAGEWALFGYEEIAGYSGQWHSNETMYEGLIAVVNAPEDESDYTLTLEYVSLDGIIVSFAGATGICPGGRFGAGTMGEHSFTVTLDGSAVTNFTVTSADESVCTVKVENGIAIVTNVGYGESTLGITVDGVSADFTWVCINDGASVEAGVLIAPEADSISDTQAALGTGNIVITDLTEDGSGNALHIGMFTESGKELYLVVHTDNGDAIQSAASDDDVFFSVGFGFSHVGESDLSETDRTAIESVKQDVNPGKVCDVMTYMDLTAHFESVDADLNRNYLGTVKEMGEEASFCMQVKKTDLDAVGRDICHLAIVRVHDGVAETIWKFGDEYEETEDGYNLLFSTDRFSTYALIYDRMLGDIDGDDKPNQAMDLVRMMKYIVGEDVMVVKDSTDINGDGSSDILDVIRMVKQMA